jgi:hypothetical protein
MPARTVVSWSAMACSYSKWGKLNGCHSLLSPMHGSTIILSETASGIVLSVCAHVGFVL